MNVPILNLKRHYESLKPEIDSAITEVIASQQFIRGPQVTELERAIAAYIKTEFAVAVASGTDALLLSLRAMGIGAGDEVITPAFTFVATAETILRTGACPVFVDIDPQTFNLDPQKTSAAITGRTRCIIPVHLFGLAADLAPIVKMAGEHNIRVLEDCAQSFGAEYHRQKVGRLGNAGAFSFFPSKNLGGFGDGGMVTTGNAKLAETIQILSEHGGKDKYNITLLGYNSRLDTLQAAVLLAKLKRVDEWNEKRRAVAATYRQALAGTGDLVLPEEPPGYYHTYNQFTVKTGSRDRLQKYLQAQGVGTAVYYPVPLHHQQAFQQKTRVADGGLPESEKAAREVISLPVDPFLTSEELDYVITTIKDFYR